MKSTGRWVGPPDRPQPWLVDVDKTIDRFRVKGDPKTGTLLKVGFTIANNNLDYPGTPKRGMPLRIIGQISGYSIDTARKCVKWLRKHGLIDVWNRTIRIANRDNPAENGVFRAANLMVLRMYDAGYAALNGAARLQAQIARGVKDLALKAQDWGVSLAKPIVLRTKPAPQSWSDSNPGPSAGGDVHDVSRRHSLLPA